MTTSRVTGESPLVSIITPSLNQGAFIGQAIESVRAQSYPRIEHVVIDGGSTDSTLATLQSAASALTWLSEPDGGMYDALNKGIQRSSGSVVSYLNADDYLLPWAVETVVDAFATRLDVDLVFGDALCLDEGTGTYDLKLQTPFSRQRLARFGSWVQPSVFWRSTVHDAVGLFDPALRFTGDLDFWLRAGAEHSVGQLHEVLSVYRVHPAAMTSRHRGAMRREERLVRARNHGDGRLTLPKQLLGRASYGLALRRQMLAFWRAVRASDRGRWWRFRSEMKPEIRPLGFLIHLLPLASRVIARPWVRVRPAARAGGRTHPPSASQSSTS